jgi:hypothetical protein
MLHMSHTCVPQVAIAVLVGLGTILLVLLSVMVGYRMGAPSYGGGRSATGTAEQQANLTRSCSCCHTAASF